MIFSESYIINCGFSRLVLSCRPLGNVRSNLHKRPLQFLKHSCAEVREKDKRALRMGLETYWSDLLNQGEPDFGTWYWVHLKSHFLGAITILFWLYISSSSLFTTCSHSTSFVFKTPFHFFLPHLLSAIPYPLPELASQMESTPLLCITRCRSYRMSRISPTWGKLSRPAYRYCLSAKD